MGNAAFFAVDVFYWLSAFMGGYLLLQKMKPKRGRINYPLLVFHRYYRLIFPIIVVTLFISTLFRYFGSGPVWPQMVANQEKRCTEYWWTNILMIMNLHPWKFVEECVGWTWYIGIDFQLFLITPLFAFLYYKRRWLGYTSAILCIIVSSVFNYVATVKHDLAFSPMMGIVTGDVQAAYRYLNIIYSKPWGRMQSYVVGFIYALLYFEYKQSQSGITRTAGSLYLTAVRDNRVLRYSCYLIGVTLTTVLTFLAYDDFNCEGCWTNEGTGFYNAVTRWLFVLGMALVMQGPMVGRNKFITWIFSSEFFEVTGRLTYMVYLLHVFLFLQYFFTLRAPVHYQSSYMLWLYIYVLILVFLLAIPCTLLFEVPFMTLEKLVLFPAKPKREKKKQDQDLEETKLGEFKEDLNESSISDASEVSRTDSVYSASTEVAEQVFSGKLKS